MTEGRSTTTNTALRRLAEDLAHSATKGQWEDQGHLIDFLAEQAIKGTDLHKAYPEAFQSLLQDASLRQVFIDLIDSIEEEKAGEAPELPVLKNTDLGFLRDAESPTKIEQKGLDWRLRLRRTAEDLRSLYLPHGLAYRSVSSLAEQAWFPLLREDIDLDAQTSIAIGLEVARTSSPEYLGLFTSLASNPSSSATSQFRYALKVNWGAYEGYVEIGESYRFSLPPIPVKVIEENLDQDLRITLDVIHVDEKR